MYMLGKRSQERLVGVHPDLVKVVNRAIRVSSVDFTVLEGLRSVERQEELVEAGKSKTMNSRHLTGHAVDVAPWVKGNISWDWKYFYPIADAFMDSAIKLNVPIRWGGNWHVKDIRDWKYSAEELVANYSGKFFDLPHFELSWESYPK